GRRQSVRRPGRISGVRRSQGKGFPCDSGRAKREGDKGMIWAPLLCALLSAEQPAQPQPPTAEQVRFFETSIRPLMVEHCVKCHAEKKQWAGLRLDSRAGLIRGGDTGAAIVPAKPEESLLIRAVRHEDEDLKMPKEGKLSDRQIADLVRWIEMGAPFPDA